MNYRLLFMILAISLPLPFSHAQHENIPYEDVENICEKCNCLTAQDTEKRYHHMLGCAFKKFQHILARWPEEFGRNHNGVSIVSIFSGNSIEVLQQLPATNASLTFSCRHCGIKHLQAPTFMDVPNIQRLDLSFNELNDDELTADVFRGPFRSRRYEPIALRELDLSHNRIITLDRKIFEHTPHLVKLNISYNRLLHFYPELFRAVPKLEVLDLSHTGLNHLSMEISKSFVNLKALNLAGNRFKFPPADLKFIGHSLRSLNLAGNLLTSLNEDSFTGLYALRRLNISYNRQLTAIGQKSFLQLHSLESLYCANNTNLEQFNLDSLINSRNLTHLDISHCSITSLILQTSNLTNSSSSSSISTNPWPKLHSFDLEGNPWLCDCELLQTLDYMHVKVNEQRNYNMIRCDTPYVFSGAQLSNLTAEKICSMQIPKRYRVVDEDPPRFLRKRYIILTLITASVVIGLGLLLGFVVACVRRRLKRDDFGIEPIRYSSVRCSTLSATFSNPPPHTRTSAKYFDYS